MAILLAALFLLVPSRILAEGVENDAAAWAGGLVLVESERGLDYSLEYQYRYSDDIDDFSSQFVEAMGYYKANPNLLLNGGYRFTKRQEHNEDRLYLGGFLDLTKTARGLAPAMDEFRATFQVGYQRDFNTSFDDTLMNSNSIRWVLVASQPYTPRVKPFLLAGILTTWNQAYSFGIDKIRLGGGLHFQISESSRLRFQYMWEKFRFREPEKRTNIFWVRYEFRFGH